jgi:hypothetical protein
MLSIIYPLKIMKPYLNTSFPNMFYEERTINYKYFSLNRQDGLVWASERNYRYPDGYSYWYKISGFLSSPLAAHFLKYLQFLHDTKCPRSQIHTLTCDILVLVSLRVNRCRLQFWKLWNTFCGINIKANCKVVPVSNYLNITPRRTESVV